MVSLVFFFFMDFWVSASVADALTARSLCGMFWDFWPCS